MTESLARRVRDLWSFLAASEKVAAWRRKLAKTFFWIGLVGFGTFLVLALYVINRLGDDHPITYEDDADHFKYGSTGGERGWAYQFGFGIPYWIWIALPEVFPEYLPEGRSARGGGYEPFGMIYEEGMDPRFDLPIGMSLRRVQGIDRVYFNCAVCHTGSVRSAPAADREIVLGMPANTFDLGALVVFLSEATGDWRFRSSRLMPKIDELAQLRDSVQEASGAREPRAFNGYRPDPLNPVDRLLFSYVAITLLREQLLTLTSRLSFIDFPSWGPGRVNTFNGPKALLGFPMDSAPSREQAGNADFPSVWNQKWKQGMQLHWDGNNTRVDERNLSAGFGTGATPATLDKEKVLRVADWLWDQAQPPPFPEDRIDRELAAAGEPIYRAYCWDCHGHGTPPFKRDGDSTRVGTVTHIDLIGTDRARLDSYTPELASAQGSLYAGYPEDEDYCRANPDDRDRCYPARFSHFRKTYGYANMPLDGLWLRAPYLHNGSVPNLRMLLEPSEARPKVFYIGYDVYDYENVGFVTQGPQAAARGWRFDTAEPGNGNQGHEYGTTELSPEQKAALLEYLKTF